MAELDHLLQRLLNEIEQTRSEVELEAVRIAALGKKGSLSALLGGLGKLTLEARKGEGARINQAKEAVLGSISARKARLKAEALTARLQSETLDLSLPVKESALSIGRVHPLTQVMDEVIVIFADMGFAVAQGPEIESDDFNFSKLNFPPGHPARDMQDTFFLNPTLQGDAIGQRKLLRTHTSPVQVRTMLQEKPPIRVICPGRVYRSDQIDQTHLPMFHQVEGLVIDKSSNLSQLKWVLEEFCRAFFEIDDVKMRFRPSFFPFTEPSLEVDIQCDRSQREIRFGVGTDWMEILGCGMVHPRVLRNCGLDPDIFQGFAWGMGLERIAMLKYGMDDLRPFVEGDVRWLSHYGFKPFDIPSLAGGLT